MDPVKLPALPNLPDLPATGLRGEEHREDIKLIKIATMFQCLIGLTNKGHVLKMDGLDNEDSTRIWRYVSESMRAILYLFLKLNTQLPNYSEIDKIKKHPVFHATRGRKGRKRQPQVELSSKTMLVTHVSYVASINSEFHA